MPRQSKATAKPFGCTLAMEATNSRSFTPTAPLRFCTWYVRPDVSLFLAVPSHLCVLTPHCLDWQHMRFGYNPKALVA